MTRHRTVSAARLALLAGSALLCATAWLVPRLRPAPRLTETGVTALLTERDRLAPNTDAARAALRQKAGAAAGPVWDAARLAKLQWQLGPGWQWSEEGGLHVGAQRIVVRAVALDFARWPDQLAALDWIKRQPGIVVERVDFAAEGAGAARKFVRVVFTLRLLRPRARTPGNKERAAPLPARSLFRGQRHRPGGERSRVFFSARPAVRLRLPAGLRSGENARPFLRGPLTTSPNVSQPIQPWSPSTSPSQRQFSRRIPMRPSN